MQGGVVAVNTCQSCIMFQRRGPSCEWGARQAPPHEATLPFTPCSPPAASRNGPESHTTIYLNVLYLGKGLSSLAFRLIFCFPNKIEIGSAVLGRLAGATQSACLAACAELTQDGAARKCHPAQGRGPRRNLHVPGAMGSGGGNVSPLCLFSLWQLHPSELCHPPALGKVGGVSGTPYPPLLLVSGPVTLWY